MWIIFGILCEQSTIEFQGTIYFICGNMIEHAWLPIYLPLVWLPIEFGCLKHGESAHYVSLCKGKWILNASVHLAFSSKMDNAIHLMVSNDFAHHLEIAGICFDESIIGPILDFFEIGQIPSIGQFVQIDNMVFRIFVNQINNQVTANETGTASNQYCPLVFHKPIYINRHYNRINLCNLSVWDDDCLSLTGSLYRKVPSNLYPSQDHPKRWHPHFPCNRNCHIYIGRSLLRTKPRIHVRSP